MPPENEEEEAMAELWRDLLRVDPIGVHDSFFELGGHSLVATQMLIRLRENLDVGIDLATLFQAPTIRKLLEVVENERWTRAALDSPGFGSDLDDDWDDEEEGEL